MEWSEDIEIDFKWEMKKGVRGGERNGLEVKH